MKERIFSNVTTKTHTEIYRTQKNTHRNTYICTHTGYDPKYLTKKRKKKWNNSRVIYLSVCKLFFVFLYIHTYTYNMLYNVRVYIYVEGANARAYRLQTNIHRCTRNNINTHTYTHMRAQRYIHRKETVCVHVRASFHSTIRKKENLIK